MVDLSIKLGNLKLKNPVMVASGTFGYAQEFDSLIKVKSLGAIVTKTITLDPRVGNSMPRTCETPSGMLNSIGLENPGLEKFIQEKLPSLAKYKIPLIVSIAAMGGPQDFALLAKRLNKIKEVSALELNISCPNVKHKVGKVVKTDKLISQDPEATYLAVKKARSMTNKTLITKLSPNVTDIVEIAQAAARAGSDCLALVNTFSALGIDIETRRPKIGVGIAGLSGPAIRPIALRMVWQLRQKIKLPIIGMGGIIDAESALEFFIAGANAIAVGTGNFINPACSIEIISGLKEYLIRNKISKIEKLTGSLNL
jgi:dihydroorotate dehydrogenase (NAD+) catalytic subunit